MFAVIGYDAGLRYAFCSFYCRGVPRTGISYSMLRWVGGRSYLYSVGTRARDIEAWESASVSYLCGRALIDNKFIAPMKSVFYT